ncbi:hypothetical protein ACFQPA_04325 [Halomarina halobia]|uniref:Uncharacterized protein n=1 Tax=Halomarina halobia TaxID=3033386 RepID=A0ABD6A4W3_9EURY|nr:hypothetical protein [Halomarina sp. PSR21]
MSYDLRPTERELSEARALATVALDACEREYPIESPLSIAIGWTDDAGVAEEFGGVSGTTYPGGEVELAFNAGVEGWADRLGPEAARLYGEAWYRERVERVAFRWQRLLAFAAGDRLAARAVPDAPRPWRGDDPDALDARWTALRETLGSSEPPVIDRAFGGVAAAVVEELAPEGDLSALAGLTRTDVREAGDAALRELR